MYEIIGKEMGGNGADKEALERVESMWSLRTGKSVRMQQWGSWICYEDQNTGSMFWYDQKNKVNSWAKPKEVEKMQEKAMGDATSRWDQLQKCGSMRLKKLGEWIQYTGGGGKTFYFNEKTYEFQWERPEALGEEEGGGGGEGPVEAAKGGGGKGDGAKIKKAREKKGVEQGIAKIMQVWTTYRDPETGLTFWHNKENGESLWEPPPGLADLEKKLQAMARDKEDEEDDGEAMVVGDDLDLGI